MTEDDSAGDRLTLADSLPDSDCEGRLRAGGTQNRGSLFVDLSKSPHARNSCARFDEWIIGGKGINERGRRWSGPPSSSALFAAFR